MKEMGKRNIEGRVNHRVHIDWQWLLSGVHPIMMVKSAQPGEGGGCTGARTPPFILSTIASKVVVGCSSQEGRNTPPISPLPLLYSLLWTLNRGDEKRTT